ncbi:TetR/AcrR family transcriptional regulator [Streptomyces sp. NBRC 110028]|uniref:TetR/AcrR family transcriptional regulator n=1 Tax=Streptomyces sp. NBRC 110028 TaxID=1621260 RepID=UPI0006E25DF2|nr:TetR/AcrR family transcriptional regulator [Streptomyces sp. NBRC 110028]
MAEQASESSRGPYRKGIERRRQIVEAAAKIFAQYGYAAGSLRHIAAEVGVTNAALIKHFGDKEGLLTAVLDYWDREAVVLSGTGLEYFRSICTLMEYHTTHRGFIELFLTLATEASNPEHPAREFFVARYNKVVAEFATHLREAQEAGQVALPEERVEQEARALVALLDGIEIQWLLNPELDLVGFVRALLETTIERWQAGHGFVAPLGAKLTET